jgi:hypothetical protein
MTPGSFDPATARQYLGDAVTRAIEEKARRDAELGEFVLPPFDGVTYAEAVRADMARAVYSEQYRRRRARIERTQARQQTQN